MKRGGFTLIELMLATTLTVMLMVGVMSVIASINKPLPALKGEGEALAIGDAGDAVVAVIQADLSQAVRAQATKSGGLELLSYAGIDAQTHGRTQRPVLIRYAVREVDGLAWLIREQQALDRMSTSPFRRELVASGFSRIELLAPPQWVPVSEREDAERNPTHNSASPHEDSPPVEGLWRLRLWSPGARQPWVDRQLLLRRDLEPEDEQDEQGGAGDANR